MINTIDIQLTIILIVYGVIGFVAILGIPYTLFHMIKLIINPMIELRPIRFRDFYWYNFIITTLLGLIFAGLGIPISFGVIGSLITLLYMHYFDSVERNKVL